MKTRIFFALIGILGLFVLTSCKEKQEAPTQEVAAQAPQIENEVDNAPKFIDYGDDELGQALMTYQKNGFWFKNQKPKLIESKATRIDFYEPYTDNGKDWQFAKLSRNFDFDGELMKEQVSVLVIYEGEENLRKAIETFLANFRRITKDSKKTDYPRTLISQEVKEISGGVSIKDSYEGPCIEHQDFYEGKKVFLFGFDYKANQVVFMFDLK